LDRGDHPALGRLLLSPAFQHRCPMLAFRLGRLSRFHLRQAGNPFQPGCTLFFGVR
jgi:hypothetical protein